MNDNTTNKKGGFLPEPVVIPDECGDSMWDAVLSQEINDSDIKQDPNTRLAPPDKITPLKADNLTLEHKTL